MRPTYLISRAADGWHVWAADGSGDRRLFRERQDAIDWCRGHGYAIAEQPDRGEPGYAPEQEAGGAEVIGADES